MLGPRERLARIALEYGIEIRVLDAALRASRSDYTVFSKPASDAILARYVPTFEAAWRRYPPSLMRRAGLRRIVIGADVRVNGQPRAAVPEFREGWFWLDAAVGARLPDYGRKVVHHDFFHMIDERDSPDGRRDRAWAALNPPGVRYGIGGWWMQTGNASALRRDLPGFLTAYATSAVEEDKAETFCHMIVSPGFVAERVAADPVVAAKVARMRTIVAAFEPAMGESWWNADVAR